MQIAPPATLQTAPRAYELRGLAFSLGRLPKHIVKTPLSNVSWITAVLPPLPVRKSDRWAHTLSHTHLPSHSSLSVRWMIWPEPVSESLLSIITRSRSHTICWHFSHSAPFADRYTYRPFYCSHCQTGCFRYRKDRRQEKSAVFFII